VAGFVADFDADHAEAAFAEGAGLRALDFDRDRGGLSRLEIPELADAQIAVTPRDVEEEVTDGANASFRCGFSGLGTDALQCAQSLVEDARPRPVDGGVEKLGAA
jgi:hypothetical protein